MAAVQRGNSVNLVNRFWTIDAVTAEATLADPSLVVFEVLAPDGTETTYTSGVDANVTNPAVGIWVCALDPPIPAGTWRYRCTGTGAVEAASEELFDIEESGVLTPTTPGVATPGPCSPWINGDDVAMTGADLGVGSDHWLLDEWAYIASHLLYEASGRMYPGVCTRTVRPCRDSCRCWGGREHVGASLSSMPFYWGSWWGWGGGAGWSNGRGGRCGCGSESYVPLAGYPVRELLEVKIDGVVQDLTHFRLDDRDKVIYLADLSTTPPTHRYWPACQDLTLPDSEPSTCSITYTWGVDVPLIGRQAAAELARELYLASVGGKCRLPSRVTKVVRQGVTYERIAAFSTLFRSGATGLQLVDAFIATANPQKIDRRPAVWSPDVTPFARKVGR